MNDLMHAVQRTKERVLQDETALLSRCHIPSKPWGSGQGKPQKGKNHAGFNENGCRQSIWEAMAIVQAMVAWTSMVSVEMMETEMREIQLEF